MHVVRVNFTWWSLCHTLTANRRAGGGPDAGRGATSQTRLRHAARARRLPERRHPRRLGRAQVCKSIVRLCHSSLTPGCFHINGVLQVNRENTRLDQGIIIFEAVLACFLNVV